MTQNNFQVKGLNTSDVLLSRQKYGSNKLNYYSESALFHVLKAITKEPMIILLLIASLIYFVSGKIGDGIFMSMAILLVAGISIYQNLRSTKALNKLKDLTQPKSKVIREGEIVEIKSEEIVIGDSLLVEEGQLISADGKIIQSHDFSVNESILTGESFAVYKDETKQDNLIFQGTTVSGGSAIAKIIAIGNQTKLGKIGRSMDSIVEEKTQLELKINRFVRRMVIAGFTVFSVVWMINYFRSGEILNSLLKALTLAMSILPEEIPVAFTSFMAIGSWRLMKLGVIVKQMKTIETLGSATVICLDKTGTITENRMSLAKLFVLDTLKISEPKGLLSLPEKELIALSMWASEPHPFDAMEIALHDTYSKLGGTDERFNYKLIYEYPLKGKPPMMTHIFENSIGQRIIAAKGSPEAIINVAEISVSERECIDEALTSMAQEGYRVLAVGETSYTGRNFPKEQQAFKFKFKGLIAFYDPPKKNIRSVLQVLNKAGINVKILTGDNAITTSAIAKQIGFKDYNQTISGEDLMKLNDQELKKKVKNFNLFTRMFPEAKLKIINVLKDENDIVAMTGDGVNDGPALKAAHIGIAMGNKGTEIAKQAASLILVEDDLIKLIDAIAAGRKIHTNLIKAIRYIISIHIPIILTVFVPLVFNWTYSNLLLPAHIILLELIMGPTCSIIYENEPLEKNTMLKKPRKASTSFLTHQQFILSILQGTIITLGTLFIYQYSKFLYNNESITRTMIFIVLISSNLFLTLVNRSTDYSVFVTFKYKNNLIPIIIILTIIIATTLLYIQPISNFFSFEQLNACQLISALTISLISVGWYEILKLIKRKNLSESKIRV